MTTKYPNQSVQYSDGVNSLSLVPNTGLVITDGTYSLTANTTGFTNGVQSLLFSDLYATVAKTDAIVYPAVNPTTLTVRDKIIINDVIGNETVLSPIELSITDFATSSYVSITPTNILIDGGTQSTTIGANLVTFEFVGDTHQTHIDNTHVHILDTATNDEMLLDHNSLIIVQPSTTHQTELLGNMLDFQTPENIISCGHTTYQSGVAGFEAYDLTTGDNSFLGVDKLTLNGSGGSSSVLLHSDTFQMEASTNSIVLTPTVISAQGTSDFQVNHHYNKIDFVESLAVINTLTSTNWSGSSAKVDTTSDNSTTTCYIPFTKTVAGTGKPLYVDDTTGPLTYKPSTGVLTSTNFTGSLTGLASSATNSTNVGITSNTSASTWYIPLTTGLGNQPLKINDNATYGLTYSGSGILYCSQFSGELIGDVLLPTAQNTATFAGNTLSVNGSSISFKNSSIIITGGSNSITALTLTNMSVGGRAYVGILNSGSGNLTIQTGLGTNIKTTNSGSVNISSGRYGLMEIRTINFNGTTVNMITTTQLTN